jgi:hypothetical protein
MRRSSAGSCSGPALFVVPASALTRLEETLRFPDDVVRAGKVDYVGLSDFAGWQLHKAVDIAESGGLSVPVRVQPRCKFAGPRGRMGDGACLIRPGAAAPGELPGAGSRAVKTISREQSARRVTRSRMRRPAGSRTAAAGFAPGPGSAT